jgi:hypothetical protein
MALIGVSAQLDLTETPISLVNEPLSDSEGVPPDSDPRRDQQLDHENLDSLLLQPLGYVLGGTSKSFLPKIRESTEYAPGPSTEIIPLPTIDVSN